MCSLLAIDFSFQSSFFSCLCVNFQRGNCRYLFSLFMSLILLFAAYLLLICSSGAWEAIKEGEAVVEILSFGARYTYSSTGIRYYSRHTFVLVHVAFDHFCLTVTSDFYLILFHFMVSSVCDFQDSSSGDPGSSAAPWPRHHGDTPCAAPKRYRMGERRNPQESGKRSIPEHPRSTYLSRLSMICVLVLLYLYD